MEDFYRIRRLPPYVFEQVNRAKAAARNAGADIRRIAILTIQNERRNGPLPAGCVYTALKEQQPSR